jgi:hypothetical protein
MDRDRPDADTPAMNHVSSRWKLLLLIILALALAIAFARLGYPPCTGMWDGPR